MMNVMRKYRRYRLIFILLGLIALTFCKKEDFDNSVEVPNKITLYGLTKVGNSITIKWSSIDTSYFEEYVVRRYFHYEKKWLYEEIAHINSSTDTVFTDSILPMLPYVAYSITSKLNNSFLLQSNTQELNRPQIFVSDKKPFGAVYNSNLNLVFITDYYRKDIFVANYITGEYIGSIKDSVEFGYICTGNNGFGEELYIPKARGVLLVYDALTLKKKYEILFSELQKNSNIYSVTTDNKGRIYLSVNQEYSLRIVDRASFAIIGKSEASSSSPRRLMYMPKINAILGIISPSFSDLYVLDNEGLIFSQKYYSYNGTYPMDDELVKISADEKYFISSESGIIYNNNLRYIGDIDKSGTDFETSADGLKIYKCSGAGFRGVQCYSYPSLELISSISTIGYPLKIHREGDTLYCISLIEELTPVHSDIMLEKYYLK